MDKQMINIIDGTDIEFWYARDLQKILGYQSWNKFQNVIQKVISCENSNVKAISHFRHVEKMVQRNWK